jgi:hypothetical protein
MRYLIAVLALGVWAGFAAAGKPGKGDPDARYIEELLTIIDETQSRDTFAVTAELLSHAKVDAKLAVPRLLRGAERVGLFADHVSAPGSDGEDAAEHVRKTIMRIAGAKDESGSEEASSVPAERLMIQRIEGIYAPKNDNRTPIMPPIREGFPPPVCEEAPCEQEVLRALPRVSVIPHVYDVSRDDIQITTERMVDKIDAPRFFPLVGIAQLHHCHWKCSVYYTETVQASYPFPVSVKKKRAEVVYIDKDHLHLCPDWRPNAVKND